MTEIDSDDIATRTKAGGDVIIGIASAIVALAILIWLIPAQVNREATGNDVAPAFIPQLSAWIIVGLSVLLAVNRIVLMRPVWGSGLTRQRLIETMLLTVAAALVWLSLATFGFLVTAAVVILCGGVLARQRPYWWMLPLAVLFPILVNYAAWQIFFVKLP